MNFEPPSSGKLVDGANSSSGGCKLWAEKRFEQRRSRQTGGDAPPIPNFFDAPFLVAIDPRISLAAATTADNVAPSEPSRLSP
jgi:predicted TIM-barrel enzyme